MFFSKRFLKTAAKAQNVTVEKGGNKRRFEILLYMKTRK
jgi:hypothetical protein